MTLETASQAGVPRETGVRPDPHLDYLAEQTAIITGASVVLAGVLTGDREEIVASRGWQLRELPMPGSFARVFSREAQPVVIADASKDERLLRHPLVAAAPGIRFFAGIPLRRGDGSLVAFLSAIDRSPRQMTSGQIRLLQMLSAEFTQLMVLSEAVRAKEEERAAVQELLDESESRFRDFFEQTDDMVLSIGADGTLLHANEALSRVLGLPAEETRGPVLRLIQPEMREEFRGALAAVFATSQPQRVETNFITAGARRVTVEGTLSPRIVDGRPVLARVIFRDITERKDYEAELGSARDAALEAARLKAQFLTNVSHEIRTPMNGILGMLDLLLATPSLTPDQSDFAHQARASAEQLHAIVANILSVSTVEAGSITASNLDFDLLRTLQRIVEVMKVAALGKELSIAFQYDEGLPPVVRGSRKRLSQIVTNLLDNAIKFTERGSVSLRVFLQTETESHRLIRFEVRDTGIGISDEDRLLLFERFSQVDAASTRRYQGVGLGLAAARHLVETMGGLMDVESTPGVGSTFWFSIPFPRHSIRERPVASSELELRGRRVLLSDQLPTSERIVRHYLETTWEMQVTAVRAGSAILETALEAARSGTPFDLVIFDRGPDLAVERFVEELQTHSELANPGVILLTNGELVNEEALRKAGVSACLQRPVGHGELFEALTMALAREAVGSTRPQSSAPVSVPETTPEMRAQLTVLVADDNFLNRKLTLSQLEKLGYPAMGVANGREVLEALDRHQYGVILMDCQMPVLDGYGATLEIRRREQRGSQRHHIIAMTANAREGDREKCLAAGMDDYLAKPTKHNELEAALARFLHR